MRFSDQNIAYWFWVILIGILAGFLAGKLMRGKGFGVLVDLLLGIVGSFVGSWIFGKLGIERPAVLSDSCWCRWSAR